jgi:hypothetical protein
VVIAFGIAVSTVLGRFVIPIYYVLGERLGALGRRPAAPAQPQPAVEANGQEGRSPESAFAEHDIATAVTSWPQPDARVELPIPGVPQRIWPRESIGCLARTWMDCVTSVASAWRGRWKLKTVALWRNMASMR